MTKLTKVRPGWLKRAITQAKAWERENPARAEQIRSGWFGRAALADGEGRDHA